MTISTKALDACAEYLLDPCFIYYRLLPQEAFYKKLRKDKRLTPDLKKAFELHLIQNFDDMLAAAEKLELPKEVKDFFVGLWFPLHTESFWGAVHCSLWGNTEVKTGSDTFDQAVLKVRDRIEPYQNLLMGQDAANRVEFARELEDVFRDNPVFYLQILSSMESNFDKLGDDETADIYDAFLGELHDPTNPRWKTMRKADAAAADALATALFTMSLGRETGSPSKALVARCFWALRHPDEDPLLRTGGKWFELFAQMVVWTGCHSNLGDKLSTGPKPTVDAEHLRNLGVPESLISEELIACYAIADENPPEDAYACLKHRVAPKSGWPETFVRFMQRFVQTNEDHKALRAFDAQEGGQPCDEALIAAAKTKYLERYEAFKAERRKRSYKKATTYELFDRFIEAATMTTMTIEFGDEPAEADRAVVDRLGEALLSVDAVNETEFRKVLTSKMPAFAVGITMLRSTLSLMAAMLGMGGERFSEKLGTFENIEGMCRSAALIAHQGLMMASAENEAFIDGLSNDAASPIGRNYEAWPPAVPESFIPKMCDYMMWLASRPTAVAGNLKLWPEAAIERMKTAVRRHVGNLSIQSWENLKNQWEEIDGQKYPDYQGFDLWLQWFSPRAFYNVEEASQNHDDTAEAKSFLQRAGMIDSWLSLLEEGTLWRRNADWLFTLSRQFGRVMRISACRIDDIGEVGVILVESEEHERMVVTVGMADEIARKTRLAKGKMPAYSEEWLVALPKSYSGFDSKSDKLDAVMTALLQKAATFLRELDVTSEGDAVKLEGVSHVFQGYSHLRKLKNERKVKKPGKKGAVKVIPGEYDAPGLRFFALPFVTFAPERAEA